MFRSTLMILMMSLPLMTAQARNVVMHSDEAKASSTRVPVPSWMRPTDVILAQEQGNYALFVQGHPPDRYTFVAHVGDAWHRWSDATWTTTGDQARGTLTLVGWSVWTLARAMYEMVVGRFTEAVAHGRYTPEDAWEARTSLAYARAVQTAPWYRFDVWGPLHDLWVNDRPTDVSFARQLERRYAFTTVYGAQGILAALVNITVGVLPH